MNAENTAQRLQETAAKCLSSLDAWNKNLKDSDARENLLEAVHELRKVTSRLEIDIAMNDRKAVNAKIIPIPEHRSKVERKVQKPLSDILPVAEIKESNRRKKIEIENNQNSSDDQYDDDEGDDDGDHTMPTSNTNETSTPKNAPKQRRPRRKKSDEHSSGE